MNLHQLLSQYSFDQLQSLADSLGIVCMSPSTRNLIKEIHERYRSDRFVAQMLSELPEQDRGFLQGVVFLTRKDNSSVQIPEALLKSWYGTDSIDHLQLLLDAGLVFQSPESETSTVIIPDDLRGSLYQLLRPRVNGINRTQESIPVHEYTRVPVLEAVFHLLALLDRHKAPITKKGEVHRKAYEFFCKRFQQDPPLEREFDFILGFCRHQELIRESGNAWRTSAKGQDWFHLHTDEMLDRIWTYLLQHIVYPIPVLQQVVIFLCASFEQGTDSYDYTDWLEAFFHNLDPQNNRKNGYSGSVKNLPELFVFCGLLAFHEVSSENYVSITQQGKRLLFSDVEQDIGAERVFEPCLLQPNFDVMVPPSVEYTDLWKIEQVAEFCQRDVMTHYHLSQTSVLHAMRRHWKQENVVSLLNRLTDNRIPQNVLYSVEEWCGKYGEITLKRVVLLECRSANIADELAIIPDLQPLLTDRVSERHFAVVEQDMKMIARTLQERGYEPAVIKTATGHDDN